MKVYIGRYPKDDSARKIRVRIDRWDVWSMEHTLSLIILPCLKLFRSNMHGYPGCFIEPECASGEVSPHTKPVVSPDDEQEEPGFIKWKAILDKMIWSFEEIANFGLNEPPFPDKIEEIKEEHVTGLGKGMPYTRTTTTYEEGAVEAWKVLAKAYQDKVNDGLKLFGEYYQHLWD